MSEPHTGGGLDYESRAEPIGRRPRWVWTILGIYLLLAAAILLMPAWTVLLGADDLLTAASITACVLTLCGMGLLFTPVQRARRRPVTRRSVWIPILSAGTLLSALFFAAGIAMDEYFTGDQTAAFTSSSDDPNAARRTSLEDSWETGIFVATGATWLGWAVLFALLLRNGDPESLSMRINRSVLVGSVAELLIAVPLHIIVRKRSVCCAGYLTGTAIGIGAAVMIVAFGPSVFLLYRRRWQQIRNK